METIRIGVIGVGQIGKNHLEEYSRIAGAKIVVAADINENALLIVSEKYSIPHTYTDFQELIMRDDIDAVDVCMHNNYHANVTIAALQSGKHVYCEKPIAGSYADGKAMVDTARECGKKLHIQLGSLYLKETKAAIKLIEEGKLGTLYHARSTGFRRRGRPFVDGYGSASFVQKEIAAGGALYDMGVYNIAQIVYLLGMPPVQRISGKIYQEKGMNEERRISSGYNVEELGMGFVKFEGGATLDIIESWAIHLNTLDGSSIVGSEGGLKLFPFSFHTTFCYMEMDASFDLEEADFRWHQTRQEDAYDSSPHHWIAALQGRVDLLPTAEIALQTMLISEGIYLSDRLGREVHSEEVIIGSKSIAVSI